MLTRLRTNLAARAQRPDDGSALVMAIVFVTVIGLVTTIALGYSAVSLRASSEHYVPARDRLYAADAAVKAAVRTVMADPSAGRSLTGGACQPSKSYSTVGGKAVTVQVCPQGANSLTTTSTGGGGGWGLTTLATGSEVGIDLTGKRGLQVNGNVYVNSSISVGKNATLAVSGGVVQAVGGCTGTVTVDGKTLASCKVAKAPGSDPGYVTGLTGAPAAATGTCDSKTDIADLKPGTWSQDALDKAIGNCDYVWMEPGIHYLNSVDWGIKERVVAGRLVGDIKVDTGSAPCVRGGAAGDGAMLILGGASKLSLSGNNPSLSICGLSVDQPKLGRKVILPLYGVTADIAVVSADTLAPTANPTGTSWTNPANAKTVDGTSATYSLAKNATSNPLVVGSVSGAVAIPASVTSLNVDVTALASASATFTVTVLNSDGSTSCTTPSAGTLPTAALAKVTVAVSCTKALVAPLTLQFRAITPNNGSTRTITVDGMVASYSVTGPTIAAQSGCVIAVNGCPVFTGDGNGKSLWLDGEVYLPLNEIDLKVPNLSSAVSTLGMVVRVLTVHATGGDDDEGDGKGNGKTSAAPIIASDNTPVTVLNDGDVTVVAKVGSDVWVTCRVTFTVSGNAISTSTTKSCTIPR